MKPQDFMDALGGISQERLDALAKWQKSGTPLTGAEPETDNPARTGKPVITQKRNRTMKRKTEKPPARLRAWTAGIAAAVVLCSAVAIPVGREAVRRAQQSNAGFAESEIAEPVANASNETWIVPDGCSFLHCYASDDWKFGSFYDVMPEDTKLKAYVEDAWNLSTGRISELCHPGAINVIPYDGYDIYFIGLPMKEAPDNLKDLALIAGTLSQSGKLHLQIGALTDAEQAVRYFESEAQQYAQADTAFVFAVPEGTLPEIREVSSSFDEIPLANFLTDAPEAESERHEWYVHLIEQNRWLITANGEPGIRLVADDPAEEILTVDADPQPDTAQEAQYVALMQEYYKQKSGIPCDFDFTGMGRDLNETLENNDARFHIKGIVGCDWTIFVFIDVELLNLSTEDTEHFSSKSFSNLSDNMCLDCGILDANGNPIHSFNQTCRTMPAQQSLDNGIFHCYSIINNHSDEAVTGGEKYLGIGKRNGSGVPEYEISIPLDCLQSTPLQESSLAAIVSTFIPDNSEQRYYPQQMTRCAVTPFGVYSVSDQFKTAQPEWAVSCFWLEIPLFKLKATPLITQNDANGSVIRSFDLDGLTCWGSTVTNDTGISFADFLFDRPYETTKGMLIIQ